MSLANNGDIKDKILRYRNPKRIALSKRIPILSKPILAAHIFVNSINLLHSCYKKKYDTTEKYPSVICRHQSPLARSYIKNELQTKNKIKNISLAIEKLNGLVILPGKIFSFWKYVGAPTEKRGYKEGMLLTEGKIINGVGGGLCQLSNLLHWLFLHSDLEITERYHHSYDVFPDNERAIPFGSGATIMYNTIDLKVKNTTKQPILLKLWMTDTQLCGQLRSQNQKPYSFHVYEKESVFIKSNEEVFRYNKLYRDYKKDGEILKTELVVENFAPVMYEVDSEKIIEFDA